MDDLSVIQWIAGGTAALLFGGVAHLQVRIASLERQLTTLSRESRLEAEQNVKELWTAREKDLHRRDEDQKDMVAFREYVLKHLATKDDVNALENRIAGAVRMIVNERRRKDIDGNI